MGAADVISELGSCCTTRGFKFSGTNGQFTRDFTGGFQSIIIATTQYENDIVAEIHVGVRHERIESMIYSITKGLKEFESNSHTILTSMGRLLGKRFHRYTCEEAADILNAKTDLVAFMESHGWYFLNQITDLNQLHQFFNTFSAYNNQLFYNDYLRAIKGLTIARLVDFNSYQVLKDQYETRLRHANYPKSYRNSYNALVLLLDNYCEN
ncbi:MAG: hypothetical protein AAF149_08065 [Bacteroidota bacterium]